MPSALFLEKTGPYGGDMESIFSFHDYVKQVFDGKAFQNFLLGHFDCGLRFQLTEGGAPLKQVLVALGKAARICEDVFEGQQLVTICITFAMEKHYLSETKKILRSLEMAGIPVPPRKCRSFWVEEFSEEDLLDSAQLLWKAHIAYNISVKDLSCALWCCVTTDHRCCKPSGHWQIRLFNLNKRLIIYPYDDRGMDIVGFDEDMLIRLYRKYNAYLEVYHRKYMDECFMGSASGDGSSGKNDSAY
jgi:hypothetical protein